MKYEQVSDMYGESLNGTLCLRGRVCARVCFGEGGEVGGGNECVSMTEQEVAVLNSLLQ